MSTALPIPDEWKAELAAELAPQVAELVGDREDGFLDVEGAARFLACPPSRIYSLSSAGRIPVHRDGSRLLFVRRELREWVHNGGAKRP